MSVNQSTGPHVFVAIPLDPIYLESGIVPRCKVCGAFEDDGVHLGPLPAMVDGMIERAALAVARDRPGYFGDGTEEMRDDARLAAKVVLETVRGYVEAYRDQRWYLADDIKYTAYFDFARELISDLDAMIVELEGDSRPVSERPEDPRDELLRCIWLHVNWYSITKRLTTEQKDLWADIIDTHPEHIREGDEPVRRWWRDNEKG